MTTVTIFQSKNGRGANNDDFRRVNLEFIALLEAIGLVKVPMAGQIDQTTAVMPGAVNTSSGYEIWRMTDALQAQAPVFFKFEYGMGGGANVHSIWITVGTGCNESGDLTGIVSSRVQTSADATNAGVYSYACATDGFVGVAVRVLGASSNLAICAGTFSVSRTCDANGYPTAAGVYILWGTNAPLAQVLRFSDGGAVVGSPSTAIFQLPLGIGQTVNGEIPIYPLWMPLPQLVPVFGVCAMPNVLMAAVDFTDIALVGSRERRYLIGKRLLGGDGNNFALGMLWE